jgi:hypothetical protein
MEALTSFPLSRQAGEGRPETCPYGFSSAVLPPLLVSPLSQSGRGAGGEGSFIRNESSRLRMEALTPFPLSRLAGEGRPETCPYGFSSAVLPPLLISPLSQSGRGAGGEGSFIRNESSQTPRHCSAKSADEQRAPRRVGAQARSSALRATIQASQRPRERYSASPR